MANKISMTPEDMKKAARWANKTANTLQNGVIDEMDSLLRTLEASWEGDAIEGYKERYSTINKALKNGKELLFEIEKNLNTSREIIEETDRTISKKFKSMGKG